MELQIDYREKEIIDNLNKLSNNTIISINNNNTDNKNINNDNKNINNDNKTININNKRKRQDDSEYENAKSKNKRVKFDNDGIDWKNMVSASSTRNYLLNDPCIDWMKEYNIKLKYKLPDETSDNTNVITDLNDISNKLSSIIDKLGSENDDLIIEKMENYNNKVIDGMPLF